MIRPQGTFEPSSDWSLNKVAACVSCDHMWSPNCFSDSANSTIDKLASFYDTTSLAPTSPTILDATWGQNISFLVLCWFLSFPWFLKLVQHAQYIPAGKSTTRHANIRWRSGKPPNSKAHCAPCPYPPEIQWRWAGCCLFRPLADHIPAGGPRTLERVFLFFARHITFGILVWY